MNQRTCPACGAVLRGALTSCIVCGASLTPGREGPESGEPRGMRRLSASEMENSARTIRVAERLGLLPGSQAKEKLDRLMAVDRAGIWWSFVPDSRLWYRSREGRWEAAAAPGEVFLRLEQISELTDLSRAVLEKILAEPGGGPAQPARAREGSRGRDAEQGERNRPPEGSQARAQPVPRFCGKCGKPLKAGKRFCIACGAPMWSG